MTTDDLTERIARALAVALGCEGTMIDVPEGDAIWCTTHDNGMDNGEWCREVGYAAAAVLPIVEAELRAAKAEAWDEGCEAFEAAHKCDHIEPWGHLRDNPYRATETRGSDEH